MTKCDNEECRETRAKHKTLKAAYRQDVEKFRLAEEKVTELTA
jgi:hypothetical protein